MNILEKISKSRSTLLDIYKDEWNIDVNKISSKEVEQLYDIDMGNDPLFVSMGIATACNFSLTHKYLKDHQLHVIYYNFPEIGRTPSKVTKSLIDKLDKLYSEDIIGKNDSIALVVSTPITKVVENYILDFNKNNLKDESVDKGDYEYRYFKNVHIYYIDMLVVNLLEHEYVPKHTPIRDNKKIQEILNKYNINRDQLPIIKSVDTVSKLLRLVPGDLVEIDRKSATAGKYLFYRICKD